MKLKSFSGEMKCSIDQRCECKEVYNIIIIEFSKD